MGGFVALADGAGAAVSNEELVSGTNGAGAGGASSWAGAGGFVVVAAAAGISYDGVLGGASDQVGTGLGFGSSTGGAGAGAAGCAAPVKVGAGIAG